MLQDVLDTRWAMGVEIHQRFSKTERGETAKTRQRDRVSPPVAGTKREHGDARRGAGPFHGCPATVSGMKPAEATAPLPIAD